MKHFEGNFEIVATTSKGLEEITANEIRGIGATDITVLNRAISYTGNLESLYKANLSLRTALRVLVPIFVFSANNERVLYKKIYDHDWAQYFTYKNTIAINTVAFSDIFKHSQYVSLKVKDGIVDHFRDKFSIRPSVDLDSPDIRIHVHINNNQVRVSLDSSGDALFKRGYRTQATLAPLNEVLAAGLILLSGWDKKLDFYDPMCGSGTIPIEAAMIAGNITPGLIRKKYSFMNWKNYNNDLYHHLLEDMKKNTIKPVCKIFASDIDSNSVQIAKDNAKRSGLIDHINFSTKDYQEIKIQNNSGIIISNPPYGERLDVKDISLFYKQIGDFLKNKCKGFSAWFISSNLQALKLVGLRPSEKILLYNGPLKCQYKRFDIYEGSKKSKYNSIK